MNVSSLSAFVDSSFSPTCLACVNLLERLECRGVVRNHLGQKMKRNWTGRKSTRRQGANNSVSRHRRSTRGKRSILAAVIASLALPNALQAQAPVGGNIVAGSGTIDQSAANLTQITTSTDRAVINWNDFSVGQGHTVNFDQLAATSAVLNRVVGAAPPSLINGAITSNGNVFVSNASGVVIGSTGVINTNGFTATTLDITNQRFMTGDLSFRGDSPASVVNNGTITTGQGGAHFIASQVINNGTIASTGKINLATGGRLDIGSGAYVQADLETIANGISNGSSLIQNSGTIRAIGGLNVGGEVYLINPNGKILHDAKIVAALATPDGNQSGGRVEMIASGEARIDSGSIEVDGHVGGKAVVTGQSVAIQSSTIDASGDRAGGEVRIGGGWKGQEASISNANMTRVSADSVISVDAIGAGDAGSVVIWADQVTEFAGQIVARALGVGNGGQAEVSGKDTLVFTGNVDLRASQPEGQHGTLLLDPATFTLDAANEDAIRAQWGSGNLIIEAADSIDITVDLFPTDSPGGDEKFSSDGSKTSLTLREQSGSDGAVDITIAAEIRDHRTGGANTTIDAGTGSVTVTEDGLIAWSLGGTSFDVDVSANSMTVAGSAFIDTLTATGNETIGIGDHATGTLHLSDETIGNLTVSEIYGSDFDLDMGESGQARSSLKLIGDSVNIDRFGGSSLDIESDDLTITGPVVGNGSFRFRGQANQTIGLGSGSGDLQFSKSILAGITGFYSFDIGHQTASGSDISIVDAGLNFSTVTLRGSSIDIDQLSIGTSLNLLTDNLNVQNAITKGADTGTLTIQSMSSNRTVGLGDGTAGLLNITANEFAYLGSYNLLNVTVGSGVVTTAMDFTGNYQSQIEINNAGGLVHLDGVSVDSNLFRLFSNDLQITNPVMGDIDRTALDLNASVSRMAVGSAAAGDWTIDNTEFGLLSGFNSLTLHNTQINGTLDVQGGGVGSELDFSSITSGTVNFLADGMRLSDVSVPENLNLSVFSGLAFDSGVITDDPTASLKITAGRVSGSTSGSTTIGIGTGTTGAVQLDDDELLRIQNFETLAANHVYSSSPGSTHVDATLDRNLTLGGGQQTTIDSLTMTGGSDLDVSTHYKSGGSGNPGADTIDIGEITSDGDINLDSSRVEVDGDVHTVNGDVSVDAQITTIGDGSQTSHVSIGSANGTTTIETQDLHVNASANAGAQIGYAFSGTETSTAAGDIVIEASGDVNLTGQGAHFASIGHGDGLGGDDTGKTVSGDVTVSGGKNVTVTKGHIGHLIDPTGNYASGNTQVFAGMADFNEDNENRVGGDYHQPYSLTLDSQSVLKSAAFGDGGQLSLYAPALSSYNIDASASLNGGNATGDPPTKYAGPSDPGDDFLGGYAGDAVNNWSIFTAAIGLDVQITDATTVYGQSISSPATVGLLSDPSVLFGTTTVGDLGMQVNYDGIDDQADAGIYVLQVDSDNLLQGYYIRKVYRNGETYNATPITNFGRHTISPANLTIAINDQTKTFGDLFDWQGNEFIATGLVNGDLIENLMLSSGGTAKIASVLGGPYVINGSNPTGTAFNAANYDIVITPGTMTINPAPLDVTLYSRSKLLGLELESKTTLFDVSGLKNSDAIFQIVTSSEGLPATAVPGTYALVADQLIGNGLDLSNYSLNLVDAVLTVMIPNDETVHDVWSRPVNIATTLPLMFSHDGGAVQSNQAGRSSVEITVPQGGGTGSNDAGQSALDEARRRRTQQTDDRNTTSSVSTL